MELVLLNWFRRIALAEAVSFLLLLLIAMPLKYMWGLPIYVRVVGMIHGLLFVLYVVMAFAVSDSLRWSPRTLGLALLASVLPAGPFFFERRYLPRT